MEPYQRFVPNKKRPINLRDSQSELVRWASPVFNRWTGPSPGGSYGGKAIVDFKGEAAFAELAVVKALRPEWASVWLSQSFGKLVCRDAFWGNPPKPHVPSTVLAFLDNAYVARRGTHGGTWDIVAWPAYQDAPESSDLRFIELKKRGGDEIDAEQIAWFEHMREIGVENDAFLILEWQFRS